MIAIAIFAGMLVLFLIIGLVIYNGIISRMNAVERGWANVITQERQKNKIIPHLEKVVEDYKLYEGPVQEKITALRTALGNLSADNVDTCGLAEAEQVSKSLMQGLQIAVENYPDLKASQAYNNLMQEIAEQQENIGAAIRIFNQNVEDFNNGIEVFPNSLINDWFNRKQKVAVFTDAEAQSEFEYSPNIT